MGRRGHILVTKLSFFLQVSLLLVVVGVALCRPSNDIIDIETDLMEHEQEGVPGTAVEGEYSWVAPNGQEVYVKYVADDKGFRVLDSEGTLPGDAEVEAAPAEEEAAVEEEGAAEVEEAEAEEEEEGGEEEGEEEEEEEDDEEEEEDDD